MGTETSFDNGTGGTEHMTGHSTNKRWILITTAAAFIVIIGFCLVTAVAVAGGYGLYNSSLPPNPAIIIDSPRSGEIVEPGQDVEIHADIRDEDKVIRAELWVNGELMEVRTSQLTGGISPFPFLINWNPSNPGVNTLTVRAFNSKKDHNSASIQVNVQQSQDSEGDEVTDLVDLCPETPGYPETNGCPDCDGDDIADSIDLCPEEAGLPENSGCPMPADQDSDGDSVLDESDLCLDTPGSLNAEGCLDSDCDGLADMEDECPAEPGLEPHNGCPVEDDMDADGVPDSADDCPIGPGPDVTGGCPDDDGDTVLDLEDHCPDDMGLPEHGGCPDRDGDGIPDHLDLCPDMSGSEARHGCPDSGAGGGSGDRDGDTIADDIDLCPERPGPPEYGGCPAPGDEAEAGRDGIPGPASDIVDFLLPHPIDPRVIGREVRHIEFEALEFQLDDDYDSVTCYTSLGDRGVERWGPFNPEGLRIWDLREYAAAEGTSNSFTFFIPVEEQLVVNTKCIAETRAELGADTTLNMLYKLGSFTRSYPMSDSSIWEDQIFTVDSTGGEEGYTFQASYRICPGSCEPAEISPPIISIRNLAGSPILILHEDRENIAGFRIYVDGVQIDSIGNDNFSFIIDGYKPPCGQTREYYVTAFNDMRESPPSNVEYLTADPCPRRLRITFERIITGWSWGGLPDLYDISGSDTMGPIYGRFNVYSGYPIHSFVFDTSECIWVSILRYCGGLRLRPTREYDIMEDVFREEYEAPDRNYFTIEFDLEDDVTIGGDIEDRDGFGGDDRMFDGTISMRARDILPGEYPIGDRNIILMVNIEELPTP